MSTKSKRLIKGFTAIKGEEKFELKTEVFSLGFYLFTYKNGKLLDQTARKTLTKAEKYIKEWEHKLEKQKYTITYDLGFHRVTIDKDTLQFKTSII